jgi:[ribosomal protein S5]-alanine N-acetyltransferase
VIATARLRLRPLTPADVPKIFSMSQESGMRRWIPDQVYRDEAHAADVVATLAACTAQPFEPRTRPFVLGIELANILVGHVGLSPARGSVEIGYAVEARMHGRGIASEAVRAMAEWALGELPEVLGIVAADNVASCRVLVKVGFMSAGGGVYRRTR